MQRAMTPNSTSVVIIVLGVAAHLVGGALSGVSGINSVVVGLAAGILFVNIAGPRFEPDDETTSFVIKRVLKLAVIFLGAGIDGTALAGVTPAAIGVIALSISVAMAIGWWFGRRQGLEDRSALLIGVGTAICGASAIAAVAPVLKARKEEMGLALATVFSFNAIALIAYPLLRPLLGLGEVAFGAWAGMAVHDTASSVATGFAYTTLSGETATVFKLARTLFLLPLIALLVVRAGRTDTEATGGKAIWNSIPWFVLGFAAMAVAGSLGWLGDWASFINNTAKILIVFVVVAVGMTLKIREVMSIGRPLFLTGFAASIGIAVVSFGGVQLLGL